MIELRELQLAFRDALLGGEAGLATTEIEADGLPPEARLSIYRHHIRTTLTAALSATYPVVRSLVDERFFGYAADEYIRSDPPTAPCLHEYGASFPEFLAHFEPSRHLVYLPDVARLEWAMNVAWHAEDAIPLEPARLSAVASADLPRATFIFEPSVWFVVSDWPIDQIWRANQRGGSGDEVDLAAGGVRLEVRRRGDVVGMRALSAGDHALRYALFRCHTLERAAAAAFAADPLFDLTASLHELLEDRIIAGFAVSK